MLYIPLNSLQMLYIPLNSLQMLYIMVMEGVNASDGDWCTLQIYRGWSGRGGGVFGGEKGEHCRIKGSFRSAEIDRKRKILGVI